MGVRIFDLTEHEHLHGFLASLLANGLTVQVVASWPMVDIMRLRVEGEVLRDGVEGAPLFHLRTAEDGARTYLVDWNRDGVLTPFRPWFQTEA
jgi:hypothetical protein